MKMQGMCAGHGVAYVLTLVGAVNWGLVGVAMLVNETANWNVVNLLLGNWPVVEAIVYILVGLSALFMLLSGKCKACKM